MASMPTITDETLYKWNRGACILHFVQGTFLFVSAFTAPGVKDFEKDITTNWLAYDVATDSLVSKSDTVGTMRIGLVVGALHTNKYICICAGSRLL
jgi:hypothetical protein